MHTSENENLIFNYNSDLSGDIIISKLCCSNTEALYIRKTELLDILKMIHSFIKRQQSGDDFGILTEHEKSFSEITITVKNTSSLKDATITRSFKGETATLHGVDLYGFVQFIAERMKENIISKIEDMSTDEFLNHLSLHAFNAIFVLDTVIL